MQTHWRVATGAYPSRSGTEEVHTDALATGAYLSRSGTEEAHTDALTTGA